MDCHSNGRDPGVPSEERLNSYALVIYIPDPLGAFLDDLRRELVPTYNPHAHVSVLPPRPLTVAGETAGRHVRALARHWQPFDVELTDIEVFPETDVIYIEVGAGASELCCMHETMSADMLAFCEPFVYHPHITLAQELAHDRVPEVLDLAVQRWRAFPGRRTFRAERAAFVQSTLSKVWVDLAEFPLGPAGDTAPVLTGTR